MVEALVIAIAPPTELSAATMNKAHKPMQESPSRQSPQAHHQPSESLYFEQHDNLDSFILRPDSLSNQTWASMKWKSSARRIARRCYSQTHCTKESYYIWMVME